jgi:hypothetical protein
MMAYSSKRVLALGVIVSLASLGVPPAPAREVIREWPELLDPERRLSAIVNRKIWVGTQSPIWTGLCVSFWRKTVARPVSGMPWCQKKRELR